MRHLLLFLTALVNFSLSAQSVQEVFGTPEKDESYPMIRLTNGDLVFAGNTLNPGFGGKDVLVTRTDSAGNILWSKQYGGSGDETVISLSVSSDGGILAGGESFSVDPNGQAFIFKLDGAGVLQWWKDYGGAFYDITYSVLGLADGSIISAGLMETSLMDYDAFLMKTDANGDTLWTKIIGRAGIEHAVNVIQTADSGFIFCGKALGIGQGVCECWIVKTDMNGDTLWTSVIGGAGWDESMDILEMPGGYTICGGTNSEGFSNYDFFLMNIDLQGNLIWVKQYGGIWVEASYCLVEIPGEGYAIAGYTETYSYTNTRGNDSANAWIVKTDYTGDTLWSMVYGGNLKEECFSVVNLSGGRIAFSGYTGSFGDSLQVYVFMTDSAGYTGCNERRTHPTVFSPAFVRSNSSFYVLSGYAVSSPAMSQMNSSTQRTLNCGSPLAVEEENGKLELLFPNPAGNEFTVQTNQGIDYVVIYSINGEQVSHSQSAQIVTNLVIPSPQTAGTYFVQVVFLDGTSATKKLVVTGNNSK
ncbi:MAG TPA: T9SS type A sorting domain-containing protein [Bacteroidia bacterium]|nr:T9SS type A sorting domain-containing protein [Bacteroidia bacterium]